MIPIKPDHSTTPGTSMQLKVDRDFFITSGMQSLR